MTASATEPRDIGFILTRGYALMSLVSAVEPLRAANHLAERTLYRTHFLSVEGGFGASTCGGGFDCAPLARAPRTLDVAFVVAGGNPMVYEDQDLIRSLRVLQARGVRLGGISGGAAILARHGFMAGRRFTLHWQHIDALQGLKPDLLIERAIYVIDRDRSTCAGGVAALDMMCAIIAAEHGADFARRVSEWFIYPRMRTASEPQQSEPEQRYNLRHPVLANAVRLMSSHLADPLSPDHIAALSGVSARQLQRLFRERLGKPVMQFYREMRLDKSDELVQQTGLSLIDIAVSTGFSNPAHFSRCYTARFGAPPSRRRQMRQAAGQPR